MTKAFLALALALTMLPVAAVAQQQPGPMGPGPQAMPNGSLMRSFMQKERQLHDQLRTQVLSALTADHRALVAKTIGDLAVAPSPDPQAAAQQLDAALSPSEKQQIQTAQNAFETQSKALHQQMMAQLQKVAGAMRAGARKVHVRHRAEEPATAGGTLLRALLPLGAQRMLVVAAPKGPPPSP